LVSNKAKTARPAIRGVEPGLLLLPKYSPDINSIEHVFRQIHDFVPNGRSPNTRRQRDR
jgi:transposase